MDDSGSMIYIVILDILRMPWRDGKDGGIPYVVDIEAFSHHIARPQRWHFHTHLAPGGFQFFHGRGITAYDGITGAAVR